MEILDKNNLCRLIVSGLEKSNQSCLVSSDRRKLTGKELLDISFYVSNILFELTQKNKKSVVALELDYDWEYIVFVVASVIAGVAFLPIDKRWGDARRKSILALVSPDIYVSSEDKISLPGYSKYSDVNHDGLKVCICIRSDPSRENVYSDDLLYLLATSGTTGSPKLVMGSERGIVNFLNWYIEEFNIDFNSNFGALAPATFDVSLRDIFSSIVAAGCLFIDSKGFPYNPVYFSSWIKKNNINTLNSVPSAMKLATSIYKDKTWLDEMRVIFFSGEKLYRNDLFKIGITQASSVRVVNLYGPTESTLIKTFYELKVADFESNNSVVPIGKPIPNCEVALINELGIDSCDGELLIVSDDISLGYVNAINGSGKSKFGFTSKDGFKRAYKTGDLAYRDDEGTLHIKGRKDNQVKISGVRVELEEIEGAAKSFKSIRNAVAFLEEGVVTLTFETDEEIVLGLLKNHIRSRLVPQAMPSQFFEINKIPINQNGKVDRKSILEFIRDEHEVS